jgi:acetylglutamate kinase
MKLVVKLSSVALDDETVVQKFARALGDLLSCGHRVTVVHGWIPRPDGASAGSMNGLGTNGRAANGREIKETAIMALGGLANKTLVARLGLSGINALGLCGTDGNMMRLRQKAVGDSVRFPAAEVVAVTPHWLDVISKSGGVPVLTSVAAGPDGRHHVLDADQLAGACAVGWDSDALVFLTSVDCPRDEDGAAMRWLDAGKIAELSRQSSFSPRMLSKLMVCRNVLSRGVRRARIFPVSQIDSLGSFYFAKSDSGTEVIVSGQSVLRR